MKISNFFHREDKNEKQQEVPQVIFKDIELEANIGQWLDLLESTETIGNKTVILSRHLSAEEILKKGKLTKELKKKIEYEFGLLLKLIGIDKEEICILDNYDEINFKFDCLLQKEKSIKPITIRWGDFIDNCPEIKIEDKDATKTYSYMNRNGSKKKTLVLEQQTLMKKENDLWRYMSPYKAHFRVKSGEYTLSLDIEKPETILIGYSQSNYILDNESKLNEYLLSLKFPIDLEEVYKKILEISLDNGFEYPHVHIRISKKTDKESDKTTDELEFVKGILKRITMTKNGKTVSLDSSANKWKYESPELVASQTDKISLTYNIEATDRSELDISVSLLEQLNKIDTEVENVKEITRRLTRKN